jgi:hypothetical protein
MRFDVAIEKLMAEGDEDAPAEAYQSEVAKMLAEGELEIGPDGQIYLTDQGRETAMRLLLGRATTDGAHRQRTL